MESKSPDYQVADAFSNMYEDKVQEKYPLRRTGQRSPESYFNSIPDHPTLETIHIMRFETADQAVRAMIARRRARAIRRTGRPEPVQNPGRRLSRLMNPALRRLIGLDSEPSSILYSDSEEEAQIVTFSEANTLDTMQLGADDAKPAGFFVKIKNKPRFFHWKTPGDGFCMLHAILSHNETFNYQRLLHSLQLAEEMDDLYDYMWAPLLRDFRQSAYGKALPTSDGEKIDKWLSTREFPQTLSLAAGRKFADFIGLTGDIILLLWGKEQQVSSERIRCYTRNQVEGYKPQEDDVILTVQGAHAMYTTVIGALAERPFIERTTDLVEKWNFDWNFADVLERHLGTPEYEEIWSYLDDKYEYVPKDQIELHSQAKKEEKQSSDPKKDYTGLLVNDAEEIKVQFVSRFRYGKEAQPLLSRLPITQTQTEGYVHPYLRTVADFSALKMLQRAFASGKMVLEHASKYHKVMRWVPKSLLSRYLFTRPVLSLKDANYRAEHPLKFYKGLLEEEIRSIFDLRIEDIVRTTDLEGFYQVLSDVIYHDKVFESLLEPGQVQGAFTGGIYPRETGVHRYFDAEGELHITPEGIENYPYGNGEGYKHRHCFLPGHSFSVERLDGTWLNVLLVEAFQTGPRISHGMYEFHSGPAPDYPVVELDDIISKPKVITLSRVHEALRKVYHPVQREYVNELVSVSISEDPIQVNWRFFDWMNHKATVKLDARTNDSQQRKYILTSYYSELLKEPFERKPDLKELSPTYNYWCQEQAKAARLHVAHQFAPIQQDALRATRLVDQPNFLQRAWRAVVSFCCFWRRRNIHRTVDSLQLGNDKIDGPIPFPEGYEPLGEIHFQQKNSKRFYHKVGNCNLRIRKQGRDPICTCKSFTYQQLIPGQKGIHFGRCEKNIDAAIKARNYASKNYPDDQILQEFHAFVSKWMNDNEPAFINAMDLDWSEDMSLENFFAGIPDPGKRALYKQGWETFIREGRVDKRMSLFVKPDEVHYSPLADARPRLICNPSASMKAVGSYVTKLMIKLIKMVEPGFISGYSMSEFAKKLEEARSKGHFRNFVLSSDGGTFDGSQHLPNIKTVDHRIGAWLLRCLAIHPAFAIPEHLLDEVESALFQDKYSFSTVTGMVGDIFGTVFSGHPTLTTLFNTLRNILYNKFVLTKMYGEEFLKKCQVWAAGDDGMNSTPCEIDVDRYVRLMGNPHGKGGLGQIVKDVKFGPLEIHTMLSKEFITDMNKLGVTPVAERLYKAGLVTNLYSDSKATHSERTAAMALLNKDLVPEIWELYGARFLECTTEEAKVRVVKELLERDYASSLKFLSQQMDPDLWGKAALETSVDWAILACQFRLDNVPESLRLKVLQTEDMATLFEMARRKVSNFGSVLYQAKQVEYDPSQIQLGREGPEPWQMNNAKKSLKSLKSTRFSSGNSNQNSTIKNAQAQSSAQREPKAKKPREPKSKAPVAENVEKTGGGLRLISTIPTKNKFQADQKRLQDEYLKCLLNPFKYTAKAPSIMPIPTASSQLYHFTTVDLTGKVQTAFFLDPYSDTSGVLNVAKADSTPDFNTVAISSIATTYGANQGTNPLGSNHAGRRIVAAAMRIRVEGPPTQVTGNLTYGQHFGLKAGASSNTTAVNLRKEPNVYNVAITPGLVVEVHWAPTDPTSYNFTQNDEPNGSSVPRLVPFVIATGLSSTMTFAVEVRIVYEYSPLLTAIDIAMPTLSNFVLGPERALEIAREAATVASSVGWDVSSVTSAMSMLI